jgi:hypothetical protein
MISSDGAYPLLPFRPLGDLECLFEAGNSVFQFSHLCIGGLNVIFDSDIELYRVLPISTGRGQSGPSEDVSTGQGRGGT